MENTKDTPQAQQPSIEAFINDVKNLPGIQTTVIAPKVLLEIFIYGTNEKKTEYEKLIKSLEKQLNAVKNPNEVSAQWYIDNGELSEEQKIQWFMERANCYYYITSNATSIKSDFIKQAITRVKNLQTAQYGAKNMNIKPLLKKDSAKVIPMAVVKD